MKASNGSRKASSYTLIAQDGLESCMKAALVRLGIEDVTEVQVDYPCNIAFSHESHPTVVVSDPILLSVCSRVHLFHSVPATGYLVAPTWELLKEVIPRYIVVRVQRGEAWDQPILRQVMMTVARERLGGIAPPSTPELVRRAADLVTKNLKQRGFDPPGGEHEHKWPY